MRRDDTNLLWFLGKIHEIVFYGLVAAILCVATSLTTVSAITECALRPTGISNFFLSYLFWCSVGFIPASIICAFGTKYADGGEGLLFQSSSIVIIMFGHLFEDLLGMVGTPFWFLKDLFAHDWNVWKIVDYLFYLVLVSFIAVGVFSLAVA